MNIAYTLLMMNIPMVKTIGIGAVVFRFINYKYTRTKVQMFLFIKVDVDYFLGPLIFVSNFLLTFSSTLRMIVNV